MRTISFKQVERALFNLDSMRTKLLNERDDNENEAEEIQAKVDEVEELISRLRSGRITCKDWSRIQALVAERQMQRYTACLNSGVDECTAAGAFED